MKRAALIIGGPDKVIVGVYDDMRNYRAFLQSAAGGGWYEHEIVTLENPSRSQLISQLEVLKTADYSFVVFAGHGAYSAQARTTMLQLNPSTNIDENDLKVGAPKRSVIIDACRHVIEASFSETLVKAALAMERHDDLQSSRSAFERNMAACPSGIAVLYGCDVGQGAGDIPGTGGRYSSELLQEARAWAASASLAHGTALSISDAHDKATLVVAKRSGGLQIPKGEFPRSTPRFPIAVKT